MIDAGSWIMETRVRMMDDDNEDGDGDDPDDDCNGGGGDGDCDGADNDIFTSRRAINMYSSWFKDCKRIPAAAQNQPTRTFRIVRHARACKSRTIQNSGRAAKG